MLSLGTTVVLSVLFIGGLFALMFALYFSIPSRRNFNLKGKHALVTGGSKGIGKQLAFTLLSKGCNVTIVARNENDLKASCVELQTFATQLGQSQKVQWKSTDLMKGYEAIESMIRDSEKAFGPVDVLINNAGHSVQEAFEKLPVEDFEKQMKVNYYSAVYATRAVIESMQKRCTGHISFVSSAAGQCAIYGYTAYSAAKFALRGFADALHMELLPYKISVSILYPPNTDTEGFKVELETMPEETKLIGDSAGCFDPKDVAEHHVHDIERGEYCTTIGLEGWMLGVLTAGSAPEHNLLRAVTQTALAGIFRGLMLLYVGYFDAIVKRCYKQKLKSK